MIKKFEKIKILLTIKKNRSYFFSIKTLIYDTYSNIYIIGYMQILPCIMLLKLWNFSVRNYIRIKSFIWLLWLPRTLIIRCIIHVTQQFICFYCSIARMNVQKYRWYLRLFNFTKLSTLNESICRVPIISRI